MATVPPRVTEASVRRLDAVPVAVSAPRTVAPTVLIVPDVVPVRRDPLVERVRELEHEVAVLRRQLQELRTG